MRVDLHVHTASSKDSLMSPETIVRVAKRRGLDALAIIDHNVIDGAWRVQELAPFPVIVGEEIKTSEGEIAGLFLESAIPSGLSPMETISRIREQGGVVYVPHPCDRLRKSVITAAALERIIDQVDVLEVLNARVIIPADNRAADRLAIRHSIARGAGSDAHHPVELGRASVEIPEFSDAASFLDSIQSSRILGRISTPMVHLASTYARYVKKHLRNTPQGG